VNPWSGIRRSTNAWEQTHHQPTERDRSIRKRRGKLANSNRESKRTSPTSLLLSPPLRCSGRVSDISGRWEDSSSEWEWLPASVAKYMQQPTGERRVLREGAGRVASAGSTFTCTPSVADPTTRLAVVSRGGNRCADGGLAMACA
jgi:hypothetical protein